MGLFDKKTVPKATYETAIQERDAFEKALASLQQQVAVLVINEDVMRRLALRAITLLGAITALGANRKVTVALRKEIEALVEEARAAGVIEEKGEESNA